MTKRGKMLALLEKTGKTYSAKSLSKILHLNYETTRKYLRWASYAGECSRVRSAGEYRYRYRAV